MGKTKQGAQWQREGHAMDMRARRSKMQSAAGGGGRLVVAQRGQPALVAGAAEAAVHRTRRQLSAPVAALAGDVTTSHIINPLFVLFPTPEDFSDIQGESGRLMPAMILICLPSERQARLTTCTSAQASMVHQLELLKPAPGRRGRSRPARTAR